ncbi:MAG: DsrE family protein [Rhodovarius sp.]|nr:DsrE family protein [Rhodovarius sp.]MCX7931826.1 DsrE family protein [Rhodovarius sp.]MDW8314354.1 DsrE family protein [Rhodovarius sp.]
MQKNRMGRRRGLAALAGIGAAVPLAAGAQSSPRAKIVYHLNQPGGEEFSYYRQMLTNVANHLTVLTPGQFDLKVVMHGPGINLLRFAARNDPQIAAAVDELKLAGVKFEICRITLTRGNIPLSQLYDASEEDVVPSGVGRIAALQHEGYAYLKI